MMIYSFDSNTYEPQWQYAHYQQIYGLVISSSGSHILVSSSSGLLYFLSTSNSPLWISTEQYNYDEFVSLSHNGMMVYVDRYLLNSVNGQRIWEGISAGYISDQGNFYD